MRFASRSLLSGHDSEVLIVSGYGIDIPPVSADAMDDEFSGSSLDTGKWSWLDQGGSTASVSDGVLTITLNENANRIRGLYQSVPSTPWEFVAKTYFPETTASSGVGAGGIFVAENTTGAVRGLFAFQAQERVQGLSLTSPSSTQSTWGSSYTAIREANEHQAAVYLRLAFDGTSLSASFAKDGRDDWKYAMHESISFTPGIVGVAWGNRAGAAGYFNFGWFRRVL